MTDFPARPTLGSFHVLTQADGSMALAVFNEFPLGSGQLSWVLFTPSATAPTAADLKSQGVGYVREIYVTRRLVGDPEPRLARG